MDLFSTFATDPKLELEGREFPLDRTSSITVARSGNPAYVKALRNALEKNKSDLDFGGDAANDLALGIVIDVMAEHILLGWKGVEYQGKPLTYSVANAKMLLTDLPEFRKKVEGLSNNFESFKVKDTEKTGNV